MGVVMLVMLVMLVCLLLRPQPAAAGCFNNTDCSLNGVCTRGTCLCDKPWSVTLCPSLTICSKNRPAPPLQFGLQSCNACFRGGTGPAKGAG